ncbi:nucleotide-binding protein [Sedimentitalea sp.]|uniref:nucleotide-binding protein n=1 Tax=Sedimentitalea sp. TaxID=2048915 RepID=UPI003297B287
MRHFFKFIAVAGVAALISTATIADTLSPQKAIQNIGSYGEVEGLVSQVSKARGGTTFVNFGGRFPNHVFYAVILKNNASEFPSVDSLEGKTVVVNGTIELYKGKPQIILTSPKQIQIR